MKKIYISLFIVLFSLNSCNEWLDVMPQNDQTSTEYWQTKEEVEAVLGAGYVRLRECLDLMLVWGDLRGNSMALSVVTSDETDLMYLKNWNIIPTNDYSKWDKFYQVINYANMVIAYGPSVVDKDPSFSAPVMNSLLSEAYYLRALSYFYLTRTFRDVPLILEPYMTDQQSYEIPKSEQSVIFEQIILDLETALGSAKEVFSETWSTKGRATKWAIYATLADVYLWTGDYEKCITACDEVINSGRVGLIQGVKNGKNNWYTIFYPGNSNESIFELQFDPMQNQRNDLMNWFTPPVNRYSISTNMVLLFQSTEDIRSEDATFILPSGNIWKYRGIEAGGGATSGTTLPRSDARDLSPNWIVYRVADIYLMKAEALIMKGAENYGPATDIINQIRTRAGITLPLSQGSNEREMLSLVQDERAREFVAEGKRWFDLLRMAQRDGYKYKDYLISQIISGADPSYAPVITSKLQDENSHYLPIHFDELLVNRQLVQNPYYSNLN